MKENTEKFTRCDPGAVPGESPLAGEVRAAFYGSLPEEARRIREEVFVREQGFCAEFDGADGEAVHAVLFVGGRAAGTCRFFADGGGQIAGGTARIGRFALLPPFRGRGLGLALLEEVLRELKARGAARAVLDAQVRARGFYERAGFSAFGGPFDEEGCPHIAMQKRLD